MSSQEYFPTDLEFIPEDEQSHDELAQIQLFAYAMEPFQEPGLPYHNWEWHIKTSYLEAKRLYDDYQANKAEDQPDADFLVIAFAVLGHDSGYSHYRKTEDLEAATGFTNREDYSCHIVEINMRSLGHNQETIDKVKECIVATRLGEECTSVEAIITRRADIFNIGGENYEIFKEATKNFRQEVEMWDREGKPITLSEFVKASWPILNQYTRDDYKLYPGDNHPAGTSWFLARFYLNMNRMMIECGVTVSEEVLAFIKKLVSRSDKEIS